MAGETLIAAELQELVFTSIAEFGADEQDISLDAHLDALGLDSLDLVELGQIVHEKYGVKLLGEEFKDVVTVRDALALIERHLS